MTEVATFAVFAMFVGLVAVVGVRVGMIVAGRIDRMQAPARAAQAPDSPAAEEEHT